MYMTNTWVSSCSPYISWWCFDCWRRRDPPRPLWRQWRNVCNGAPPSGWQIPTPVKTDIERILYERANRSREEPRGVVERQPYWVLSQCNDWRRWCVWLPSFRFVCFPSFGRGASLSSCHRQKSLSAGRTCTAKGFSAQQRKGRGINHRLSGCTEQMAAAKTAQLNKHTSSVFWKELRPFMLFFLTPAK